MTRGEAEQKVRAIRTDIDYEIKRGTWATVEEALTAKLVEALMVPSYERRNL